MKIALLSVVTLFLVYWTGTVLWEKRTSAKIEMIDVSLKQQVDRVDLTEVEQLPTMVKRYFYHVLENGAPLINRIEIKQRGGFRAKPDMERWSIMSAQQYFSTRPRAFVWDAEISMVPGISINVLDSFIDGKGGMSVKVLSLLPLIDSDDNSELNQGALQRYLAEAVWFPTALLPSQGVTWTAVSDSVARATISESGVSASLDFEFNDRGEVISVYTPARFREVNGSYIATPWKGYFTQYSDMGGYRIPLHGSVEWHLDGKVYSYWKATLVEVNYK